MINKLITISVLSLITSFSHGESQTKTQNIASKQNQGSPSYQIRKYTISSGGGVITGGDFTITGSIGQIDAGHNATGGIYEFRGGFLAGNTDLIFKNGFEL